MQKYGPLAGNDLPDFFLYLVSLGYRAVLRFGRTYFLRMMNTVAELAARSIFSSLLSAPTSALAVFASPLYGISSGSGLDAITEVAFVASFDGP